MAIVPSASSYNSAASLSSFGLLSEWTRTQDGPRQQHLLKRKPLRESSSAPDCDGSTRVALSRAAQGLREATEL